MAQYNVKDEIAELRQLDPAAVDQLIARNHITSDGEKAWARKGLAAVEKALGEARRGVRIVPKGAEARYARVGDQWAVAVPAHVYQDGAAVVVVKRSGERKSVVVGAEIERRGDMVIAAIVEPARQQAAGPAAEAYRIGAGYGVDGQIWDNA